MKKVILITEYIEEKECEIIRTNMKKQGINNGDIAKKLNVTRQYISNMLTGIKPIQFYFKEYLEQNNLIKFED